MKPWAEQFYNSDAWRLCRDMFLQSKDYLCERCSTQSNPVVAKIAHHREYLTQQNINNPYVTQAWDNLESLCQDCHNKEHHRAERKPRYKFDSEGNVIPLPPMSRKDIGGRNTEGGGLSYPARSRVGGVGKGS